MRSVEEMLNDLKKGLKDFKKLINFLSSVLTNLREHHHSIESLLKWG